MKNFLPVFFLLMIWPLLGFSQPGSTGFKIYGTVYNTDKEIVPGWDVLITGEQNVAWKIRTDKNGFYSQVVPFSKDPSFVYLIQVIDPCSRPALVQKANGANGSEQHDFIICKQSAPNPCKIEFTFKQVANELWVEFIAQPQLRDAKYYWDFGDGQSGEGSSIKHQYASSGSYKVSLKVSSAACLGSVTKEIEVKLLTAPPPNPPKTSYEAHCCGAIQILPAPVTTNSGANTYKFYAKGDFKIINVEWNFGDGEFGKGLEVVHTYKTPGKYKVTALIIGEECKVELNVWVIINQKVSPPSPCNYDFGYKTSGLDAYFNFNSRVVPDKILWTFGDGNSSSDLNPKHTYGQPGEYKVTLEIVVKGEYCKIEKIIKVGNGLAPCPFDFDFSVDQLVVKFKPTFQQKYESLVWYFGDRTESKEEFPVHTYANEGLYQVTLVAYFNGVPCKVTKDIKISKFQNPPVGIAIIDVNPNPVDENMMIKIKSDSKVSVTLTVADVTGVNLKKIPVALEVGENLVDWNVAELATGTYLIYLYHENTIVSRYKFQKN